MGKARAIRLLSPVLVLLLGVAASALTGGRARAAEKKTAAFTSGDVFAGVGTGLIKRFSPTGTLLQTLDTGTGCSEDLGMAFDSSGNLYATAAFGCSTGTVSKFDINGTLVGPFGSGYSASTESITLDAAQNVFVGQPDGTHAIRKFSPAGTFLTQFVPAVGPRGTDWIDMSSDQCTIVYTSEGPDIRRYNTCTSTQLSNFCTGCGSSMTGMKLRSNGDVMAADFGGGTVHRFDSTGALVMNYSDVGLSNPFAVNVDPDGISFWTGGYSSAQVFRFNIATGAVISQFNAAKVGCCLSGLAIFGELVVSQPTPTPTGPVPTSTPQGGAATGIPTLSSSMLALLCVALLGAALLLMRR